MTDEFSCNGLPLVKLPAFVPNDQLPALDRNIQALARRVGICCVCIVGSLNCRTESHALNLRLSDVMEIKDRMRESRKAPSTKRMVPSSTQAVVSVDVLPKPKPETAPVSSEIPEHPPTIQQPSIQKRPVRVFSKQQSSQADTGSGGAETDKKVQAFMLKMQALLKDR